jgi:UDP-GlcNAc:undecaprenyl-phosphate GlcNAc-1-phosphate transferase
MPGWQKKRGLRLLINYIFIGALGYLSGIILSGILQKFSVRYKILIPRGIPLVGGISVALSFGIAVLAGFISFAGLTREVIGIIAASFIMLIFGILDDWKELSICAKFLMQIVAASILIIFGVRTQIAYIGIAANIIITFVWVLGITNAFNHLDVMDGLAGGCAAIVGPAFFIVAVLNNDINAAVLSLALSAATLGFLGYNLPPAKIYMGNSGSHFVGFIFAAIAMIISYAPLDRKVALLSPVFILGLPVFDTAFLVIIRTMKRILPFKKSNDHPALMLLAIGYSRKKALSLMLALCLFFSLCGILLNRVSNVSGIAVVLSVCFLIFMLTRKMIKTASNNG